MLCASPDPGLLSPSFRGTLWALAQAQAWEASEVTCREGGWMLSPGPQGTALGRAQRPPVRFLFESCFEVLSSHFSLNLDSKCFVFFSSN